MARRHGERRNRPGRAERQCQPVPTINLRNFWREAVGQYDPEDTTVRVNRAGRAVWNEELRCFLWQYPASSGYCAHPPTAFFRWHGRVLEDHREWLVVEYPGWDTSGPTGLVIRFRTAIEEPSPNWYGRFLMEMRNRGWRLSRASYSPRGARGYEHSVVSTNEPIPFIGAGI